MPAFVRLVVRLAAQLTASQDSQGRRIIGYYIPAISLSAVGAVVYFALAALFCYRIYIRHRGLEQRRFGSFLWPANLGCVWCVRPSESGWS